MRLAKADAQSRLFAMEQRVSARRGPPARLAGLTDSLQEGCDNGHAPSCYRLASAYEAGVGVARDQNWAVTAYGTACAAGDEWSCFRQGMLLLEGEVQVRPAEAYAALQSSCDAGVAPACRTLAERAARGDGVEKEPALAAALYQKACLEADLHACVSGGLLYRDGGDGLPRNGEKAVFLLELACDGDLPTACGYLGEIFLKGWGVPVDAQRGRELIGRACDGGDYGACTVDDARDP